MVHRWILGNGYRVDHVSVTDSVRSDVMVPKRFLLFVFSLSDELMDAGNRSKTLDVVVSPAIDCEWERLHSLVSNWWISVCVCVLRLTPRVFVLRVPAEAYVMGMLFCLGIFLSFYILTFLMACIENKRSVSLSPSLCVCVCDVSQLRTLCLGCKICWVCFSGRVTGH